MLRYSSLRSEYLFSFYLDARAREGEIDFLLRHHDGCYLDILQRYSIFRCCWRSREFLGLDIFMQGVVVERWIFLNKIVIWHVKLGVVDI